MDVPDDQHPSRPLSVKEIGEQASDFQWNPNIPFKYWVRAAETIFLEVRFPGLLARDAPMSANCG